MIAGAKVLAEICVPLVLALSASQPGLIGPLAGRLWRWRRRSVLCRLARRLAGGSRIRGVSFRWQGFCLDLGLALALGMAGSALAVGLPLARLAVAGGLGLVLVWLVLFDLRWLRLPDRLTAPLALAGLIDAFGRDEGWGSLATGVLAGTGLLLLRAGFRRWKGVDGLGLGDVKLTAAMGLWLGIDWFGPALLGAAFMGMVAHGLARLPDGRAGTGEQPFGPCLAFALWTAWLCREGGLPPVSLFAGF